MKRFALTLLFVSFAVVALQLGLYVLGVVKAQTAIEKSYKLTENQKYLFIGASRLGCGILEKPEFENKVLWTSSMPIPVMPFQLEELERRGQLKYVKVFLLNVDNMSINFAIGKSQRLQAYYRHLPITWRHILTGDIDWLDFINHCISSTHCPLITISPAQTNPPDRPSFVKIKRPEVVLEKRKMLQRWGAAWYENVADKQLGEQIVFVAVQKMKEICDRNNIAMVAVQMPMPSDFENALTDDARLYLDRIHNKIAQLGVDVWKSKRSYDLADFADDYHQTDESAEIQTKELYEYLKNRSEEYNIRNR